MDDRRIGRLLFLDLGGEICCAVLAFGAGFDAHELLKGEDARFAALPSCPTF